MHTIELQKFVETLKISPVEIIREEMEMVILQTISQASLGKKVIFKGGTALRLCYGSPRFSADLDFNQRQKVTKVELEEILRRVTKSYPEASIKDIINKRYTLFALIVVSSPFLKQNFSVKLEVSKKKYKLGKSDVLLKVATSPLVPFSPILHTYSMERIFFEKEMAIRTRSEPRDYFDLWWLNQKLKKKVSLPRPKIPKSQFKGELNQLLPHYLKNWSSEFLKAYERH